MSKNKETKKETWNHIPIVKDTTACISILVFMHNMFIVFKRTAWLDHINKQKLAPFFSGFWVNLRIKGMPKPPIQLIKISTQIPGSTTKPCITDGGDEWQAMETSGNYLSIPHVASATFFLWKGCNWVWTGNQWLILDK